MDRPKYNKANSFEGIRGRGADPAASRRRLEGLRAGLPAAPPTDAFGRIVRRALDALLDATLAGPAFCLGAQGEAEMAHLEDRDLPRFLFYRYRYDVFPSTKELDDFPPCLQVEPSSRCNYRCVFCYQTDREFTNPANGHMGSMPLDLFRRVIDQAQGRCEAVTLASRGEPLGCPDIEKMLEYVRGKFLAFKINTNASFLDERLTHALLKLETGTVVFSADAAAEPLYSQLRVHGNLERVLENVRRFQDIRAKQYPRSRVLTRVSGVRYTASQSLDDMEKVWGALVDQVAFVNYNPWENVYRAPPSGVESPCSDLWRRMFVWADGRVNPCDVDYRSTLSVGDAPRDALSRLWTGEAYRALRNDHLEGRRSKRSPCVNCTVL